MSARPTHEMIYDLSDNARLRIVKLDQGFFGFDYIKEDQPPIRLSFNEECAIALTTGLSALIAGGGDEIIEGWISHTELVAMNT